MSALEDIAKVLEKSMPATKIFSDKALQELVSENTDTAIDFRKRIICGQVSKEAIELMKKYKDEASGIELLVGAFCTMLQKSKKPISRFKAPMAVMYSI